MLPNFPIRQAIKAKYLGPTNFRGARIKVSCDAMSLTVPIDHALDIDDNMYLAARKLQNKLEWRGNLHGGSIDKGAIRVFVLI